MKQYAKKFRAIILVVFILFLNTSLSAQCYKSNIDVGKQQYNSGKYQTALVTFQKSLKCPDAKGGSEANQWIIKCKAKIDTQTKNANKKLKIGDNYAGGIIFYIDNTGKHGKVCASNDQSKGATWDEAKGICSNLTLNGYSDWYLPSDDELNQIYENLHLSHKGGFTTDDYWSSSEYVAGTAWGKDFYNGLLINASKYAKFYIRAVRFF